MKKILVAAALIGSPFLATVLQAGDTNLLPTPGDVASLSDQLQTALARTGLRAESGKKCSIFALFPEEAAAEQDATVDSHSLRRSLSNHDMHRILLWDSRTESGSALYYYFSGRDYDYKYSRNYAKGQVSPDHALNVYMGVPQTYPKSATGLPVFYRGAPVSEANNPRDSNDKYITLLPYAVVSDPAIKFTADRRCTAPTPGTKKECYCLSTME